MSKSRRGRKIVFVIVALLAMAAGGMLIQRRYAPKPVEYLTSAVEQGSIRNVVNATGVVQTVVTVQVGSQVSGQVQELYADFNSVVKRGQLLAKLDPRNSEAQVQNSRANVVASQARVRSAEAALKTDAANVSSAKANVTAARVARDNAVTLFQRSAELSQKGLTSKNDYDNAKANQDSAQARYDQAVAALEQVEAQGISSNAQIEQAKAQAQQAQADLERSLLNLEYCNIYSPVDGVVISRSVDVGQTIAASMSAPTLFSIANDLTRMQVNASVDEADIGNISSANNVKFTVDAYPNESFIARISEIRLSPQTVQNVVTYSVILGLDNASLKLRPGMTANITFTVDERVNVVRIPNAALRYAPQGRKPDVSDSASNESVPGPGAAPRPAELQKRETLAAGAHLAPGQNWDPGDKMRFLEPTRGIARPAVAWVLNALKTPESRELMVGITDGSFTEMISGPLKAGDLVITGDTAPEPGASSSAPRGGVFGGGGGSGNGGRRGQ